jgi:hypothetical protein
MRNLLDPHDDYIKTEKKVRKYLKSFSDSQIKSFYEAIEYTPFTVLLVHEYSSRFKKKSKSK